LTEKGQKTARQMKSTTDKKERIGYSNLQVMMQMGEDEDDDADDE
jgi:hypothetical protein